MLTKIFFLTLKIYELYKTFIVVLVYYSSTGHILPPN